MVKTVLGIRKIKEINGIKLSPEINLLFIVNLFLREMTRQLNRQRTVFSTNGTGTGYLYEKNNVRLPTSGHMQKLTQNG